MTFSILEKLNFHSPKRPKKVRSLVIIESWCPLSLLGKTGQRGQGPLPLQSWRPPRPTELTLQGSTDVPASKGADSEDAPILGLPGLSNFGRALLPAEVFLLCSFLKQENRKIFPRNLGKLFTHLQVKCLCLPQELSYLIIVFSEDKTEAFKWGLRRGLCDYPVKITLRVGKKEQ